MLGIIIGSLFGVGIIAGAFFGMQKMLLSSGGADLTQFAKQLAETDSAIRSLLSKKDTFAAHGQLETILKEFEQIQVDLEKTKSELKNIENNLETSQKTVEGKETHQQELKTAKEDEGLKLEELLLNYSTISSESLALEQRLAGSMKNLDKLLSEVQLSQEQRAVLEELSSAMTSAGSRLRDLLTEYKTVYDRLELLKQQHKDLEDEYTRLVEKQLGEG